MVALKRCQHLGADQRPGPKLGSLAGRLLRKPRQDARQPLTTLAGVPVNGPEPPEGDHQSVGRLGVPLLDAPAQRGAYVVMRLFDSREPRRLFHTVECRLRRLRESECPKSVATMGGIGFAALVQAVQRIFADGLEHQVAWLTV